jgi:predicted  nucleic acid-binding Zn-ribbon protein
VSTPAPAAQPLVQQPAAPAVDATKLQDELQTLIAGEIRKVADSQQSLSDQFAALNAKIDVIEEKTAGFAAADQVSAIADQIAASGQRLDAVQASVASLEGRIDDTARSLQDLTPDKLLGDLPGRLEKLEQRGETPPFDPQPLTESIQTLQHEVEELRKKGAGKPQAAGKSRKKA